MTRIRNKLDEERDRKTALIPLTVVCPECGKQKTMSINQRRNHRHPGIYCDGEFGNRHAITLMTGPQGKSWA